MISTTNQMGSFFRVAARHLTTSSDALLRPSVAVAKNILQQTPDWVVHQDLEPARDLMAKAFSSGEPVVDWLSRDLNIPHNDIDSRTRLDCFKFLMSFPVRDGLSKGSIVIGKGSSEEDGAMECGILFREYDPATDGKKSLAKDIKSVVSSLKMYFGMGKAARRVGPFQGFFSEPTQAYFTKGSFYDNVSSGFHSKYGPTTPHWYITAVGVDPESQGKGHGKNLMRKMGSLADRVGMDVYLECAGSKNKGFYEKMGFEEVGKEYLNDGTGEKQEIYLMIRPKADVPSVAFA